jgi:protein O-GlcNAc transferase
MTAETAVREAAEPLIARGQGLLDLRRDAEALACFEQARRFSPVTSAAIVGQCRALLRLGRLDAAFDIVEKDRLDHPQLRGIDGIRAQILLLRGQADEAWAASGRGCESEPRDPVALYVRGLMLLDGGDAGAALTAFDAAIQLDGSLAAVHQGRARALVSLDRSSEATAAFEAARRLDPRNAGISVRLGHWLIRLNRFEAAVDAFAAALAVEPLNTAALQGHAQCLAALGRAAEAVEAYTRFLAVAPGADYMRGERFHQRLHCCDWRDFDEEHGAIVARVHRGERVDNPGGFMTHSDSAADQLRCARIFAADMCAVEGLPFVPSPGPAGERTRIAYLSADFHAHATAYLAAGLFEAHDHAKFETFAISFGPDDGSDMRRRVIRAFDHFEDARALSDRQIAARVNELGIDIAVDLKGYTLGARPQIFAHRPAPVQVSFLGYPGTLGGGWIDYIIADPTVIPHSERIHYTERVIYLPESYQVNDSGRRAGVRPSRRDAGLPQEGIVFCCFNSVYKITPAVFADWMQILKAVPRSILWLLQAGEAAAENLRRTARGHGVSADRLIFAPWLNAADHLARCALADLFLDTTPYNAHTTASDALWSCVPIITRRGSSFASRVATSLLRAVGLERLSVDSREEYVNLAIRLARSPAELDSLRHALTVARDRSALFDSAAYCRKLEAVFEAIIGRARRGEAPVSLALCEAPQSDRFSVRPV